MLREELLPTEVEELQNTRAWASTGIAALHIKNIYDDKYEQKQTPYFQNKLKVGSIHHVRKQNYQMLYQLEAVSIISGATHQVFCLLSPDQHLQGVYNTVYTSVLWPLG